MGQVLQPDSGCGAFERRAVRVDQGNGDDVEPVFKFVKTENTIAHTRTHAHTRSFPMPLTTFCSFLET